MPDGPWCVQVLNPDGPWCVQALNPNGPWCVQVLNPNVTVVRVVPYREPIVTRVIPPGPRGHLEQPPDHHVLAGFGTLQRAPVGPGRRRWPGRPGRCSRTRQARRRLRADRAAGRGLAPQAAGQDDQRQDRLGRGFTLVGPATPGVADRVRRARRRRIPLTLAESPPDYPWRSEFLLVRPDQHIAWRAEDPVGIDIETAAGLHPERDPARGGIYI